MVEKVTCKTEIEFVNEVADDFIKKLGDKEREWVKFAIEHAGVIMHLDCMKPYHKDKELVYLACRTHEWNFAELDRTLRDDYELAKICMLQNHRSSIYRFMSKRLRYNKELAMLDIQRSWPDVKAYPYRLRNDDDIAAKLYELHDVNSCEGCLAWYHMSKRLKKKYGIKIED